MNELASRWMLFAMLAFGTPALSACSREPPPETYILGRDVPAGRINLSQLNSPIVELRPVRIPDYLDNKDIVVRYVGGQIMVSRDARWGERLSRGVTRAVSASLAARLPRLAVMTTPALEKSRWRVLIDIDAFSVQSTEQCVLAGRWSVWTGGEEKKLRDEKFSMSQPIGKGSDAEIVAVMTNLVDQLAASMAPAFEGGVAPRRTAVR
jgi:cholesterol transport system auxiliary component